MEHDLVVAADNFRAGETEHLKVLFFGTDFSKQKYDRAS